MSDNEHIPYAMQAGTQTSGTTKPIDVQPWFDAFLKQSQDGLVLFDEHGKVVIWNAAFEQITGMSDDMIRGKHYWDIVFDIMPLEKKSPQMYEFIRDSHEILISEDAGSLLHMMDVTIIRPDGRCAEVRQIPFPVPLEQGRGFILLVKDITEEKRIEREISISRDFLQTVIENSPDGIIIVDSMGTILSINGAVEKFFGYTREELIGKHTSELVVSDPDVRRRVRKAMEELLENGFAIYETRHLAKDGRIVEIESTARMLKDKDGKIVGGVAILRDVSERKREEQRLRQVQKMEALGTLAGGIAHDFNNILAAIMGYAELSLQQLEPGSSVYDNLEHILQAAIRARDLVRHILTFSRQSEGERRLLRLEPIIVESVKLLRALIPSTIEIRHHIQDKDAIVIGDPVQIEQIIMNLGSNASHAMRTSGGTLDIGLMKKTLTPEELREYTELAPGTYVVLWIKDTGPGIPKEIQHRIFDPFFTTKEVGQGTGMGLAVVLGIVKKMNGTIKVESELGKGTVFTILLPAAEQDAPQKERFEELPPVGNERILFVDDEQPIVESISSFLKSLGYKVTSCRNAGEAFNLFSREPSSFDVIITDQTMPGITGFELAIKARAIRNDIPIILCTGYSETVSEEDVKKVGINELVMKPISKQELACAVRKALKR